jgi:hypothetical protein
MVRFHFPKAPEIACEMGTSPVLESIGKAITRPNIISATGCKNHLT